MHTYVCALKRESLPSESSFPIIRYFLPNPASIDGEEQNEKLPLLGNELTTSRSSVQRSPN